MKKYNPVLIVTPFFSPNIGGVESHLDDLVAELNKRKIPSIISTYSPITTKVTWKRYEKRKYSTIYRCPWFGHNWFPVLEKIPFATFVYLFPGLFIQTLSLLREYKDIKTIHAQGFIAALVVKVCNIFFHKHTVMSTHALYSLADNNILANIFAWILRDFDSILTLSEKSKYELISAGVLKEKISRYMYWVDQERFKPKNKVLLKKQFGWSGKTVYLFVGRLIKIKGVQVIIELAKNSLFSNALFVIIGTGPEEKYVSSETKKLNNVFFMKGIPNNLINKYYCASDYLLVPSQYEEAMGRVVMEAMSSGIYVVATNGGGLPEMIKERKLGVLGFPDVNSFARILKDSRRYRKSVSYIRSFSIKNFSCNNVKTILKEYIL